MAKPNSTRFAFTDLRLRKLTPDTKAYDLRDSGCPGLTLRVTPAGRKVFRWTYRDINGKHRVKTLGNYPSLSLAKARQALEELKAHHQQALILGESEAQVTTVAALAEQFYKRRILKTRKRPEEAKRVIDTDIIPKIGKLKLSPIPHTPTIGRMVMEVVDRGAKVHAGKVLDITRQMFDFGVANGYLPLNPAAPLKAADLGVEEYQPRSRTLTGDEIRQLWVALDSPVHRMGVQTRIAIKLLLLNGVRTQELLLAQWKHIDFDASAWTIPVSNQKLTVKQSKTAKPFVIPLSRQSVSLFKELKDYAENSQWVMASDSAEGHYREKALSRAMLRLFKVKIDGKPLLDMPRATPHDLRRTLRTQMGEVLNIEPHICERCLNHSLGKLTATYDTGEYLKQRKTAMQRWADQVDLYVNRPANVRMLREAG